MISCNFSYRTYEAQYIETLKEIKENGIYQLNKRTGVGTYCIPNATIRVDLQKEFPILKSKFVSFKTLTREILWIMTTQSNNIKDLNGHIWDSWADETGSIGKAYGYQVAKPVTIGGVTYKNQIDYVIQTLKNDPSSRRAVIDLWDVDDLGEMNLTPCCYSSIWSILDGKLNCTLIQRSADFLVGVPFNTTQYAVLTHLIARNLGVEVGQLTHCMSNCHIYDYPSHIDGADKIISNYRIHCCDITSEICESKPKIVLNPDKTDIFTFTDEDITLEDYKYVEKISFDVAV